MHLPVCGAPQTYKKLVDSVAFGDRIDKQTMSL
jgi:hypothetical protein